MCVQTGTFPSDLGIVKTSSGRAVGGVAVTLIPVDFLNTSLSCRAVK
jgi:hypothetical protein